MKRNRKENISRAEALDCKPIKNSEVEEVSLDSGETMLIYPVKARPWISAVSRRLGMEASVVRKKLQLDKMGTSVWELLDGKRTVHQVIEVFSLTHRLHSREAEVAVIQFIRELGHRGLVGLA
ncbi:MAG: PqqD family protein [Desulfobacteraceae bacterium]|nr:MAG: PqqD family protein [Desulfobacteraceae bacterium]